MEDGRYEIIVRPEPHDDSELGNHNYFWMICFISDTGSRSNAGFGWTDSPENSWKEAIDFYNRYYCKS